jgi:hypothetical protein
VDLFAQGIRQLSSRGQYLVRNTPDLTFTYFKKCEYAGHGMGLGIVSWLRFTGYRLPVTRYPSNNDG